LNDKTGRGSVLDLINADIQDQIHWVRWFLSAMLISMLCAKTDGEIEQANRRKKILFSRIDLQ